MVRVMSQDKPSAYCDCEPCFLRYVSRYADGKPTGFDTYWDEPSAMDIEFDMPYGHLGRWLSLRTR